MSGLDNISRERKRSDTEVDAVRRHICQILGFDYGFIDMVRGHEQPVLAANTLIAQKVKQTQRPLVAKIFTTGSAASPSDDGESESYPYAIIPVGEASGSVSQVRGLIRVISFDASKEISERMSKL